jgi:hypothetical protein
MKKLFPLFTCCLLCIQIGVWANSVLPVCDTIITKTGEIILAAEVKELQDVIRFRDCDATKRVYKTIQRDAVASVRRGQTPTGAAQPYAGVPKGAKATLNTPPEQVKNWAKLSMIFGVACLFCLLLLIAYESILFFLLLLIFSILGMVLGVKGMRGSYLRTELKNARQLSMWGFGISTLFSGLIAFFFILAIIILALYE